MLIDPDADARRAGYGHVIDALDEEDTDYWQEADQIHDAAESLQEGQLSRHEAINKLSGIIEDAQAALKRMGA